MKISILGGNSDSHCWSIHLSQGNKLSIARIPIPLIRDRERRPNHNPRSTRQRASCDTLMRSWKVKSVEETSSGIVALKCTPFTDKRDQCYQKDAPIIGGIFQKINLP